MRSRECGLYEASDLLLGEQLCGKSDAVKWIDAAFPDKRKRRVKGYQKLQQLKEINPESEDIFENNLIDTHYPERPEELEEVCLYNFVRDYDSCGVDEYGQKQYKKRSKSLLPSLNPGPICSMCCSFHSCKDPGERENGTHHVRGGS